MTEFLSALDTIGQSMFRFACAHLVDDAAGNEGHGWIPGDRVQVSDPVLVLGPLWGSCTAKADIGPIGTSGSGFLVNPLPKPRPEASSGNRRFCDDVQRTMSVSDRLIRPRHVTPPLAQARRRTR
ncbi:hypothetical protein [Aliidongia dinghuensis]|uniref:hypothetical protein n=1 Tax=Aliidongia dinghuensis TaxID=1867774 RepID=UPI00166ECB85|nr:hypothetical protein [Aliidongia dinghuensis]